jgi:16S rRNA (guanine527-N7)-methyltransferase
MSTTQEHLDDLVDRGVRELRLALDEPARLKLAQYLRLLDKWNTVYNLTAIREMSKAVSVHLLDSLAVTKYLNGTRLLDVGSGAGLPGIPLAVARPDLAVTLLDSNHKKTAFLIQAAGELRLENVQVVCHRIESWRPQEKFDFIISRAFSELTDFVSPTRHLLAPGGVFAAMKGLLPYEEIERLPPEFRVKELHKLSVPGLNADRHLVLVENT